MLHFVNCTSKRYSSYIRDCVLANKGLLAQPPSRFDFLTVGKLAFQTINVGLGKSALEINTLLHAPNLLARHLEHEQ